MIGHNYLGHKTADIEEILKKVGAVVESGKMTLGPALEDFERAFAAYVCVKHAIGVASGTDALFLSLKVLGVDGGEVITSPYTFYATVGAIVAAGATPVFVDIGPDLNIDPDKIDDKITANTRAIIPVHWAGTPCNMPLIKGRYPVIEDACQAVGAKHNHRMAGSMGDLGCFSLHPLKNLHVWGDGGIITTDNDAHANALRLLRNHGLTDRDTWAVCAYNSRLDPVQAAVALHYLPRVSVVNARRNAIASEYRSRLSKVAQIRFPSIADSVYPSYHLLIVLAERRDALREHLKSRGIDAKVHYPTPLHLQPAMQRFGYKAGDFPIYEHAIKDVLSLPVHEFLLSADVETVCDAIKEFYK